MVPSIYCLSGLAGAFIARGSSYPGRFSMHIIPIASGMSVCALALAVGRQKPTKTPNAS
jgi:hypothetical protein